MRQILLAVMAAAALGGTASAQTYAPPSRGPAVGVHVFAAVDADMMAATDSFKAVFGTSQTTAAGGGVEVLDLWKHVFVRGAVTRVQKTGTRVFVDGGDVFPLGIPLTVTMTPFEVGGGWRFPSRTRLTPYVGGAFLSLGYHEESDFSEAGDNVTDRYTGGAAFGGVEVKVAKGFVVGAEARYRRIQTPVASRGVSKEFGENDLGGVSARVTIGFSTK